MEKKLYERVLECLENNYPEWVKEADGITDWLLESDCVEELLVDDELLDTAVAAGVSTAECYYEDMEYERTHPVYWD